LPQLYTRNQFGVCPLSVISLDEVVVHAKNHRGKYCEQMFDGGGQGYKRFSCKGKRKTNRCKYVNHLTFYEIQNYFYFILQIRIQYIKIKTIEQYATLSISIACIGRVESRS